MKNDYIVDGEVAREKISMDIKRRKLDRAGIERLCLDPDIQAAFFGAGYNDRRPQGEWNKDYLDRLSYAVVGECFNREYLLYLAEVAEYVSKTTSQKGAGARSKVSESASKAPCKKSIVAGIVVALVIIFGIVAYKCTLGGK